MSDSTEFCGSCGGRLPSRAIADCCPRCIALVAFGNLDNSGNVSKGGPNAAKFLGDYELLEEIGRGGMGVVYRARQAGLDREVALKVLAAGPYADPVDVAQFRAEASAAAALRHPGIVTVFEVGEADGHPYFSMELVDGVQLAELTASNPLEPRRAARYTMAVAEAVGAAHARGILHRDLKPANVIIDHNDQARVTDFGLARPLGGESTQHIAGSPGYMPPEQADPQRGGIGVASDVYGLGALLYHLLVARPPFIGPTTTATLTQVLTADPIRPQLLNARVPPDLETICLKCLAKEPARRYASAREVAEELRAFLDHRPIRARPIGFTGRMAMWARRHPSLAIMAALLAVVSGVGLAAFLVQTQENRNNLYAADLRIASEDIEHGDLGRARELLARHAPAFGSAPFAWRYLQARTLGDPRRLLGQHPWIVTSAAWSPDGRWLATGSLGSGTVGADLRLWEPGQSSEPRILSTNHIREAQWFPDNRRLLTVEGKLGAIIRDVRQNIALTNFPATSAQLSSDGRLLATCDGTCVAWEFHPLVRPVWLRDLESGRATRFPDARLCALSPSGKRLATSDTISQIDVFDAETGALVIHLTNTGLMWAMRFSPDDRSLVVTGFESAIRVWRLGPKPILERWEGHSLSTWRSAFSPDGTQLLTTSSDQTLRLWDFATGKTLNIYRGHNSEVWCAAFKPDGLEFASGGKDRNVFVWPVAKASTERFVEGGVVVRSFFSADGRKLVTLSTNEPPHTIVQDVQNARPPLRFSVTKPMALKADGMLLARKDEFDLEWIDLEKRRPAAGVTLEHTGNEPSPHVWAVTVGGEFIAGLASNGHVSVWETRTGGRIATLAAPVSDAWSLVLSHDGRAASLNLGEDGFVLCSFSDRSVRLLRSHFDEGRWSAFSPDDRLLATASSDATIKLWDVATGRERATLRGHLQEVTSLAIAPDGRTLVSIERERGLRFWDLATEREIAIVPRPDAGVWVEFSPDGHTLVMDAGDGSRLCLLQAP